MTSEGKLAIIEDLEFINEIIEKLPNVPKDIIWKRFIMSQKGETMGSYFAMAAPYLEPLVGQMGFDISKFFNTVFNGGTGATAEDGPIIITEKAKHKLRDGIAEGDKVKLCYENDFFLAEVYASTEDGNFYATIIDDLLFTEKHGAKKGDDVIFTIDHAIDIKRD